MVLLIFRSYHIYWSKELGYLPAPSGVGQVWPVTTDRFLSVDRSLFE